MTLNVDKVDILKDSYSVALYYNYVCLKQKEKGGSLIICIQYCDILFLIIFDMIL